MSSALCLFLVLMSLPVSSAQTCNENSKTKCGANCHCLNRLACGADICVGGCEPNWGDGDCQFTCLPDTPTKCDENCHCAKRDQCGRPTCDDCQPAWTGDTCQTQCDDSHYGPKCIFECRCFDATEACNKTNGFCESGCDTGLTGEGCQTGCPDCTFGRGCLETCHCAPGDLCNRISGVCVGDCADGWEGSNCQIVIDDTSCPEGTYGRNCENSCVCQNRPNICGRATGRCSKPCNKGYIGSDCETVIEMECQTGRYGTNCELPCRCPDPQTGERLRAECTDFCYPGDTWLNCGRPMTPAITVGTTARTTTARNAGCPPGKHGPNCDRDCACVNRPNVCHRTTAVCTDPCYAGYTGQDCETAPPISQPPCTGTTCPRSCSCQNRPDVCDENGVCTATCDPGFTGSDCLTGRRLSVEFGTPRRRFGVGLLRIPRHPDRENRLAEKFD